MATHELRCAVSLICCRIVMATPDTKNYTENLAFCRVTKDFDESVPCDPRKPQNFYVYQQDYNDHEDSDIQRHQFLRGDGRFGGFVTVFESKAVQPGKWRLYSLPETPKNIGKKTMSKDEIHPTYLNYEYERETQGGVFVLSLTADNKAPKTAEFQVCPTSRICQAVAEHTEFKI